MAARHRITCINKWPDHYDPHTRIKRIGGSSGGKENNGPWYLDEDKAIAGMENGTWEFYVHEKGKEVNVKIATKEGRKYLKTESDRYLFDNLLALPECQ